MAGILKEAENLVTKDRREEYGPVVDGFAQTARLWSEIIGKTVTAQQVCLCMAMLKLQREIYKPKKDNRVDICGYISLLDTIWGEVLEIEAHDE